MTDTPEKSVSSKEDSGPGTTAPAVRAVGLTKEFGGRVVVDQLSFDIFPGELYALLGDNGAGKTTTINMLTTLLTPNGGKSFICGFDTSKQAEESKACFGVVSQDVAIYQELTAYENLSFVGSLYSMAKDRVERRIEQLLQQAGLIDRANDRAGEFSLGMQRKLAIAMAILHGPRVIFMDEPTVGLDIAARRQIWGTLQELKREGVTILLTTHYLEEAELLADRIGIIRQGKLVIEGTIEELRKQIRGIRTVSITLSRQLECQDLEERLSSLKERFAVKINFDPVRNTLNMSQPEGVKLSEVLTGALDWLESENVSFSRFATSEPSLEEVFLSIHRGEGGAVSTYQSGENG